MVCGIENKRRQAVSVAEDVHVGHGFAESELRVSMDNGASR